MQKWKVAVMLVALAGLCLADVRGEDGVFNGASSTGFTIALSTGNTNLYMIDKAWTAGPRVIHSRGAQGGYLFFANYPQNSVGVAVTNTYTYSNLGLTNATTNTVGFLLTQFQTGKYGAVPIAAATEASNQDNVVKLSPDSVWGQIGTAIFFVPTNATTNLGVNISILRLTK